MKKLPRLSPIAAAAKSARLPSMLPAGAIAAAMAMSMNAQAQAPEAVQAVPTASEQEQAPAAADAASPPSAETQDTAEAPSAAEEARQAEPAEAAAEAPEFAAAERQAAQLPAVDVKAQAPTAYMPDTSGLGGKMPSAIRDIPQTVNVINRAMLDSQAGTSMKDALRYVPGITISAGEGGQIGDNFNLRGFSARTDVYLDGFRDRGQYSRDTFFLDSVEVLKGPSSMLFGRGSTGGVINQVSKAPSLKPLAEVSATIGTDSYYRATADINEPLSPTSAARVAVMGQDLQSTRDVVYNKDFGIAPSLKLGIGSPTELTLSALVINNNDLPDYGFPVLPAVAPTPTAIDIAKPIDAPANRFYGYDDDHFDQSVKSLTATIDHKLSPDWALRNRTQYAEYLTKASPSPLTGGTALRSTPLGAINLVRQDRDREVHDVSLFNQTDLMTSVKVGTVDHNLIGGFELGTDEYRNDGYAYIRPTGVPDPTLINLGNPVTGSRSGLRYQSARTQTNGDTLAAYINDQMDLAPQWKLIAGLRWDRFKANSSVINYTPVTPVTNPPTFTLSAPAQPAASSDNMFSQRAGLLWQPDDAHSYYLSYGTSFNPSAEAVTQTSGTTAPNASLAPEKNRSFELGGKWNLMDDALLLNASAFRIEKTNMRTQDLASPSGVQVLAGMARVDGLEVGAVGRIMPGWQVLAGYTFLDSKVVKSNDTTGTAPNLIVRAQGKRLNNTPEHQATLWSTYVFMQNFEVGGGAIYTSERTLNNFETAVTDAYARADATAAYHQPGYDLRVNLLNVTDKLYFETASAGRATPARGRTLLFTGTLRFDKPKAG